MVENEAGAVLVTGASRGIGRAIAIALADSGFDIGVNYKTNSEGASEVVKQITANGRKAISLQADVGNEAEVTSMVKAFTNEFPRIFYAFSKFNSPFHTCSRKTLP